MMQTIICLHGMNNVVTAGHTYSLAGQAASAGHMAYAGSHLIRVTAVQQHAGSQASTTHSSSTADRIDNSNPGCRPQQSLWHSSSPARQAQEGRYHASGAAAQWEGSDGGGAALSAAAGAVQASGGSQQAAAIAPAKPALNLLLVAVPKGSYDSDPGRQREHLQSQSLWMWCLPQHLLLAQKCPGRRWTCSC